MAETLRRVPFAGSDASKMAAMDLTYPPEAEEFRKEIRAWLEDNLPTVGSTRASS